MFQKYLMVGFVAVLALVGCGKTLGSGSDSETHFLAICESSCEEGLSCLCGVCTVTCDPASSCSELNEDAVCLPPNDNATASCGKESQPSVCDVLCNEASECASLGEGYSCLDGACRKAACLYGGKGYAEGDNFSSIDGCNSCSCEAGGSVACTERACAPDEGGQCNYNGVSYKAGATFASADDVCSTCACKEDGSVACEPVSDCGSPVVCEHNGKTYLPGDEFGDTPGCNNCTCSASGGVDCTDIACVQTCQYDGSSYEEGATFPALDGCNSCTCEANGSVACTEVFCDSTCEEGGVVYQSGEMMPPQDCNACVCNAGQKACDDADCSAAICELPWQEGDCLAAIGVYFHNLETNSCELRTYGGCGGNENNFPTLAACEMACGTNELASCEVDGVVYPHGAGTPDPRSCNTCACDNGRVDACTQIACDTPCPEGQRVGSECARRNEVDGCEVVRTGCLPTCTDDGQCAALGYCSEEGLCITNG